MEPRLGRRYSLVSGTDVPEGSSRLSLPVHPSQEGGRVRVTTPPKCVSVDDGCPQSPVKVYGVSEEPPPVPLPVFFVKIVPDLV